MPNSHAAREPLNLRIKPDDRALIDRAAKLRGKNRTSFVLDAARAAAEEALLDQTVFVLERRAYDAFLARLDAPPMPSEALKKAMRAAPPWGKA